MDNQDPIIRLQLELSEIQYDIKAEAQLAQALKKGILYEDLAITCDSRFYREYSKDVFYGELQEDARKSQLLKIHLSRTGIYNQLPEGIFFQKREAGNSSAREMAAAFRINKEIEQNIRAFFQPLESDFFLQRLQIEIEETRMLEGFESGIVDDYFIEFWGLANSIPRPLVVPLLLLLPYASKIAGNLSLTSKSLELLLGETVHVKKVTAPVTDARKFIEQGLGNEQIGVDTVCGEEFAEDYPVLEFSIGPLQHSDVSEYLEGGNRYSLLQTFYNYFLPAEADSITSIEVIPEKRSMRLEIDSEVVLGYTTVL